MPTPLPSDSLAEALLAGFDDAVVCYRNDGTILIWNSAAERLYGHSAQDVIGKPLSLLLPLYELPAFHEFVRLPVLQSSGAPERTERLHKDGSRLFLSLRRFPVLGSQGELLAVVERAPLSQLSALAPTAETHLRLLVEQLPVAFWTTDSRLHLTSHWGSGFERQPFAPSRAGDLTLFEFLRCRDPKSAPIRQHLEALRGNSSRFEYRRGKRIYDISVEPLRDPAGSIIGCIGVALDITDRKRTEEDIRYQATHDGLTGLANHREFFAHLEAELLRADRNPRPFGLLLLDLDDFKGINDRLGHLAGDRALKRFARVLHEQCRATDLAARYGGDEFAVLLLDATAGMIETVATRISETLRHFPDNPPLSASIGYAVYPKDGRTATELIDAADYRLYEGKRREGGRARASRAGSSASTSSSGSSTAC